MGPLVQELATRTGRKRIPVVVTCRVLGFTTQAYYKWLKNPVSARDIEEQELISKLLALHEDDPEGGYRVLADDLEDLGYQVLRAAGVEAMPQGRDPLRHQQAPAQAHPGRGPGARRSCATRFHRRAAQPTVADR